jgi:hypothetical protein
MEFIIDKNQVSEATNQTFVNETPITSSNIIVNSDLIPNQNNTTSLGTATNAFSHVYAKQAIIGAVSISSNANGLVIGKAPLLHLQHLSSLSTIEKDKVYGAAAGTTDLNVSSGVAQLGPTTTLITDQSGTLYLPATTKIGGVNPGTIVINGNVADPTLLPPTANIADCYMSLDYGHLYVCTSITPSTIWTDVGPFQGSQGPQGVQGPIGSSSQGIFNLLITPGFPAALITSSNSIQSIPATLITDPPLNGRVQTTNSYYNSPIILSFSVYAVLNPAVIANGTNYCTVGFSPNPSFSSTATNNPNFEAGFVISLNTFSIVFNNINNSVPIYTNSWDSNTVFTLIFDGNYFNYFITNVPNNIINKQVFSSTLGGAYNYYFLTSFVTGVYNVSPQNYFSPTVNVTNINIVPYTSLNPRICFGSSTGNWTITNSLSYLDINNVYVLPPASTLISQPLLPATGFVFSFIAFGSAGTNCIITDNTPSTSPNIIGTFILNFSEYSMYYYANNGLSQQYISNYSTGDVIQIVYKVINGGTNNNLFVYQNQFLVYTANSYTPTTIIHFATPNACTAIITNTNPSTNITVQNPQFYYYQ